MEKVIYISIVSLTSQIEKYLRIPDVIETGIKVEYWDLKNIYFKGRPFKDTILREYSRDINSFRELKEHLKKEELTNTVFVLQVYFEWRVLSLYLIMTRFGCKIVYFPWVTHARKALITRIIDKLRPIDLFRASLNLITKLCKKAGLVKKYDLVFTAGRLTRDAFKDHRRMVNINYVDYDYYQLSQNNPERIISGDYCVFLDEGCVYNEDVKILDMEQLDSGKFYGALNHFFNDIEKRFNLKVVIATHPGIKYDKNVFLGRESYEGKTCELVKDCKFVISQSSTSTSFAVLHKKPIILIYTDEYAVKRKVNFRTLEFLSNKLGLKSYNIDLREDLDTFEIPAINTDLYDNYKYSCLTSKESENELSKDIVIRSLRDFRI
jgi:hypothetical protein